MSQVLICSHVKKTFHGAQKGDKSVTAVDDMSFSVEKGERIGILGPSGCGKTTLLRCILGLEKPEAGQVEAAGRIGFVSQDPYSSINPRLTVEKIIAEPMHFRKDLKGNRESMVREAMESMRLDYDRYRKKYPQELSGGERQRVSIARALLCQPELLVLDEPASMLDYAVKDEISDLLLNASRERGTACLLVTHDITFAQKMCTSLIIMRAGREVERGLTEEICRAPAQRFTKALFEAANDIEEYWRQKDCQSELNEVTKR